MASQTLPPSGIAATIDFIGDDVLQNIVARLPAISFASAACVSRSWNLVCNRVLCRSKLCSVCSFNPSLQVAVDDVVSKVLSKPIRPHFAIASIGPSFDLQEAHQLIAAALGTQVPVITNRPLGTIGRDAFSVEFKEIRWESTMAADDDPENVNRAIVLVVGFLPGLKVTTISLVKQIEEPETVMIEEFVTDIREFSTSVSGCKSPAAIILFGDYNARMMAVMEKMDYAMSPETVIVGDNFSEFRCTAAAEYDISAAVALIFAVDRNKPPDIGETQFDSVLSSGLSPVGPTYEAASVLEGNRKTRLTARREWSSQYIDDQTVLNHVYVELGERIQDRNLFKVDLYIGVTKKRTCSIGQEKVGCMTSLSFHKLKSSDGGTFFVHEEGIKSGDTFRFYRPDSTTALSSAATVSNHLRSFNQGSNSTTGGNKREVFGGLIFTSAHRKESFFGQPNTDSSPFLDNFPGATLGGTIGYRVFRRGDLTPYAKEPQEQMSVRCCLHVYSAVYLIMSYTP